MLIRKCEEHNAGRVVPIGRVANVEKFSVCSIWNGPNGKHSTQKIMYKPRSLEELQRIYWYPCVNLKRRAQHRQSGPDYITENRSLALRALHRKSTMHEQIVLTILKRATWSSECNCMWIPKCVYCARMYREADLSQSQVMGTLGTSLRSIGTYDVSSRLRNNTLKKTKCCSIIRMLAMQFWGSKTGLVTGAIRIPVIERTLVLAARKTQKFAQTQSSIS